MKSTLLVVSIVAGLLAGCGKGAEPATSATPNPPAAVVTPDAAPKQAEAAPKPLRADKPVDLRVTTVDGGTFDLATERGRWVVVNYWATWCSPCLKEMPELSALDTMREDVRVLGLAFEDIEADAMNAFLVKHPVTYPVAMVDVYDPPAAFDVPRGLPTTHLIAPDGRVAKSFTGPVTAADIEAVITAAGTPAT